MLFTRLSVFQQPLLYSAIAFGGGIICAARGQGTFRGWALCLVLLWLGSTGCIFLKKGGMPLTVILLAGFFGAGGALWRFEQAAIGETRVRRLFERDLIKRDEPVEIIGTLAAAPELAPDRIYLSVEVESASTIGCDYVASGLVQIVAPFSDNQSRREYDALRLEYGTRARLLVFLSNRRGYRNPGATDFDRILEHRGFDAAGWVKSPLLIERLGEGRRNRLLATLFEFRAQLLAITLRRFNQPASGILAAALFGNRYFISRDAAESFRAGGTFHLLVISGLHVAMIAIIALQLVKRLSHSRAIQYGVVLTLIWSYALMVGAQPSITRAVIMLTLALIGRLIYRESAGANILAASAMVLLAWRPGDIFNSAFQLSFLTVLMIVVFTAPICGRLRLIGEWRPVAARPHPPRVPIFVSWLAEVMFWDESSFRSDMKESGIRYRLPKSRFACLINGLKLQPAVSYVAMTILTTAGIQIGLLPVMVDAFHRVSPIAPIANLIDGVLISVLMIAGSIYLIIDPLIGAFGLEITPRLADAISEIGRIAANTGKPLIAPLLTWKHANMRVPDFGEYSGLIFTAYFIAVIILMVTVNEWNPFRKGWETSDDRPRRLGWILATPAVLTLLILALLLSFHPFSHNFDQGRLAITFLDVGQGDAMVISFPDGLLMMLDAGGRPSFDSRRENSDSEEPFVEDRIGIAEAAVMPYLWRRGIKRLDWIVASHDDADHIGGFTEIVRCFKVAASMRGERAPGSASIFDQLTASSNIPMRIIRGGERVQIGGAEVEALSPQTPLPGNNGSLVLKILYGKRSFLLTGDIEKETEAILAASNIDLRADVMKVAHHGSKTSSIAGFLERARPIHAVVSAADPSPFGHPHPDVIDRLHRIGSRIWRTGSCGAITISTDGQDLRVSTFVKCE